MMPDNNPFLEGYVNAIRGKSDVCPYDEGTDEHARWCRGLGREPEKKHAAPAEKSLTVPNLEGRRPFVEGYKSAILGKAGLCPYEDGTPEFARWWNGFHKRTEARTVVARKPIAIPAVEGRRPFVEGYKSAILGKADPCPYEEDTREGESWQNGFAAWIATKNARSFSAHR